MLATIAIIALAVLLAAAVAWAVLREDARLRRRVRRYRQLELEGIEELPSQDPFPEEQRVEGGFLREPNGRGADTGRVLHDELERAREHTRRKAHERSRTRARRRGKGMECLL